MNQKSNIALICLGLTFACYVLIRAWVIPITVDECSTVFTHAPRSVWDTLFFLRDGNPNNHILNTISIKGLGAWFGWHPFVVRIPALIGAGMYAVSGFLLARKISTNRWIGVFMYGVMMAQPFMLDFFSLARGYALGLGFMMMAIWQTWRFLQEKKQGGLYFALIFAGLGVYANFTQIVFFIPFSFLLFWSIIQVSSSVQDFWRQAMGATALLLIEVGILSIPLRVLSKDSEILNWNQLGSLFESGERSIRAAIHRPALNNNDTAHILTILAVFFTIGLTYVLLNKLLTDKIKFSGNGLLFIAFLLPAVLFANIAQVELTHTPYLEPRLAILYWPLFALALSVTAIWLNDRSARWAIIFMTLISFGATINMIKCANLNTAYEWWHDKDTYKVLDYLRELQMKESHPAPYTFDTNWVMQNSFLFHVKRDPRDYNSMITLAEWHGMRAPTEDYEFYYALSEEDAQPLLNTYEKVFEPAGSLTILLRKKKQ